MTSSSTDVINNDDISVTKGGTTSNGGNDHQGDSEDEVLPVVGPDLNLSKGPYDKKLYRQILLPNGLRCVLIQDTIAMQQQDGELLDDDDNEDDEEQDDAMDVDAIDNEENAQPHLRRHHPHHAEVEGDTNDNDSNANEEDHDNDHTGGDGADDHDDAGNIRDAAVAIVVGVGSMYDPMICQGLAHFVEHLVFMGSKKYPGENDYESYVAKHGGSDNAYTEWEYTIYNLTIPQESIWPALDRLAQFFIAPLFVENSVQRELQAIESEFQLNLLSDTNRLDQLYCMTSAIDHPFTKFAWGNLKSLQEIPLQQSIDPLQEVRNFYNHYYYASNMRLVISAAYPLDVIQAKVVEYFSEVPSLPRDPNGPYPLPIDPQQEQSWDRTYNSPMKSYGFPLTTDRGLQKIYRLIPIRDKHSVSITWQIPPIYKDWKYKSYDYVAHLIGHEAAGSLLSYFRSKSIATGCTVGVGDGGAERSSCHAYFVVTFSLSEHGMNEWTTIIDGIYQYIGMIRYYCQQQVEKEKNGSDQNGDDTGLPSYIFDELQSIHELSYKYQDECSPEDTVDSIAEAMVPHANLPAERILDGNALVFEFNLQGVQDLLDNFLIPTNCRVDILSSTFGKLSDYDDLIKTSTANVTETILTDINILDENNDGSFHPSSVPPPQIEPMFSTPFWCRTIPSTMLEKWAASSQPELPSISIHLPPRNPYVPTKLDMKPLPIDDTNHTLLYASIQICISIGGGTNGKNNNNKKKMKMKTQWFPATVVRYNQQTNAILVSYEDETTKWHTLDTPFDKFPTAEQLASKSNAIKSFEDTMDNGSSKYRINALSFSGRGAVRRYGDEKSDIDAMDGVGFPPIPPPSIHVPIQIYDTNSFKLWWLQDRQYHRPIADLRLQFNCRTANSTPFHRACADLYRTLLLDTLLETMYSAKMCELDMSIHSTEVGFTYRFNGFDSNILQLFETVMRVALSFRRSSSDDSTEPTTLPDSITDTSRFDACLEILKRKYKNSGLRAAGLATDLRVYALRPTLWTSNMLLKALDGITISSFVQTISSILQEFAIEALYHGNVTRADADQMKDILLQLLSTDACGNPTTIPTLPRKKYPSQSVTQIPKVATTSPNLIVVPSKDPAEPNTSCEVYIQIGKDNVKDRTLMDLLIQIISEPFFDQVRTKDQFGYSVYCSSRWSYGIIGCIFHVTTNVKSAKDVMDRIDRFLIDYRPVLVAMKKEEFMEHQIAVANDKLNMFHSMSDLTDTYWTEIRDGRFQWEAWRDEAICLTSLSKDDIIRVYDEWLYPGDGTTNSKKNNGRKLFAVQVIGAGNDDVSKDRPVMVEGDNGSNIHSSVDDYYDEVLNEFQTITCKKQTCGRVNAKLF